MMKPTVETINPSFRIRSAAHVQLSNRQMEDGADGGQVSASMNQAAAQFTAWLYTHTVTSGPEMKAKRDEALAGFTQQITEMFLDSYDEYASNYDTYHPKQG